MTPIKKPLLLIVDDTPKNIQVLGNILHSKGYNICIATSGLKALDLVKTELPDLILLDIQMPDMDGFEVCKILKANPKTKSIPIIFLTAVIELDRVVEGFDLGAVDYITKPFNIAELTARVATHIEIKQSRQKLIELNATKDKFFSIIAHDLRNPFAGIIGISEIMETILQTNEPDDIPEFLKFTRMINASSKSAYSLLENLLQWANTQTGLISIIPHNFSMNAILSNTLEIINASAFKKNIKIDNLVIENEIVHVDNTLTATILRNLLTNAIKFTHPNGRITISSRRVGRFLEISITDTGVGIDPNNVDKIFRIDSQFSILGTENEKGTGLGLILCKEFVEKQGGTIWVESILGEGSSFKFTLPLAEVILGTV